MTIETKKPKSLEEALADLRRPEVRTSLETYVPVSFAAMRDVDGGGDELLADAAHFTLDLKYMGKLADRELAFLHEIIDVKTGVKTETGEQKETLYQKGKRFILEGGFNAEDYALFVADLWFKYYCKCETKDGISWISTKTGEQVLARIMCAITDPQYVPFGSDEDKRVYAQKGATGVPIVKNPLWEYVDAIREYKQGHGLGLALHYGTHYHRKKKTTGI